VTREATFSPCRRYRYALWRRWGEGDQVLFVMLNPSTADERTDDPTLRRCVAFARSWGYGALAVGNLFGYRTSRPAELHSVADPVGTDNDDWVRRLASGSALVVAAWGNRGRLWGRSVAGREMVSPCHMLGLTRQGEPRHPLYMPAGARPVPWPREDVER